MKKCPMSFNAVISTVRSPKETDFNCIGEKCTWWVEWESQPHDIQHEGCSIAVIASMLIGIKDKEG